MTRNIIWTCFHLGWFTWCASHLSLCCSSSASDFISFLRPSFLHIWSQQPQPWHCWPSWDSDSWSCCSRRMSYSGRAVSVEWLQDQPFWFILGVNWSVEVDLHQSCNRYQFVLGWWGRLLSRYALHWCSHNYAFWHYGSWFVRYCSTECFTSSTRCATWCPRSLLMYCLVNWNAVPYWTLPKSCDRLGAWHFVAQFSQYQLSNRFFVGLCFWCSYSEY